MPIAVHHPMINYQSDRPASTARGTTLAASIGRTLRLWRSRLRERRAFPVLGDRDLGDLRVTRWELEQELRKPFWRG
jgi:uncharacterized protein YjiS (DUF1127 family)